MEQAKMQMPDASRAEVVQELESTELDIQLSLKVMRMDAVRARIVRSERYVMRQSKALNPDTLLRERLLEDMHAFFRYFVRHPRNLSICQRLNQKDPTVWTCPKISRRVRQLHWPHLQSMRRVMLALSLNHLILVERGHGDLAQPAVRAARELQRLLDDDSGRKKRINLAALTALPPDADVKFHLRVRRKHGYEPMRNSEDDAVSLAVHPAGGIFIGLPGHPTDIDLSLMNPNKDTFPDPSVPAKVLIADAGIQALFFTDCKGRDREVGRDKKSDAFCFIE